MPIRILLAFVLAVVVTLTLAQSPHTHRHDFSGAERWAQAFDDPARDAWQKPHEVIQALKLAPDARVADIGAGTGYFSVRLAHMVPQGKVYAVDTEPDMVRYLSERAKRDGLANLLPVQGTSKDARLAEPVDRVLLVDVFHHIGDPAAYFRTMRGSLKAGAEVAIIDFRRDSPVGPPVSGRVTPEQVQASMKRAGYELARSHDFLPNQFFLVFAPH